MTKVKGLLVMDVDSTLIQEEGIDLLGEEAGVGEKIADITARAMNGELDFKQALDERVSLLKGLPESIFEQVLERMHFTKGAEKLVAELHRRGYKVGVVSGGFHETVDVLAKRLGLDYVNSPIAIIDYAQDDSHREEGYIIGEVANKKAILIDDILNTGRTFAEAAKILEREGATEIYAVASHGLFAGGAADTLNTAPIKEIVVTDSVDTKELLPKNLKYLSASELIADAIIRIHEKAPLSPLFSYDAKKD